MFGGGAQPQQPAAAGRPIPYGDNPFGKVLQDMFGGGLPQRARAGRSPQQTQKPLRRQSVRQDLRGNAAGGGGGGRHPAAAGPMPQAPQQRQARAKTNPSGRAKNPYDDLFGKMFETGAQQRDEYQKGVENIFDQFKRDMDRR